MNRPSGVCIFGNTCSGKSSLGFELARRFDGTYVSFGDLKRDLVINGDELGLRIASIVDRAEPIPPELSVEVVRTALTKSWNFLSGYPISDAEMAMLEPHCRLQFAVHLRVEEEILRERFLARRECPICHRPGREGSYCIVHEREMRPRPDAREGQWRARMRLYKDRIAPFVLSLSSRMPVLDLIVAEHGADQVADMAYEWVSAFGGESCKLP